VCVSVCKSEREQEAEETSLIYADLKAARETIEEQKLEKGIDLLQLSNRCAGKRFNELRN